MPSNPYSSFIGSILLAAIMTFVRGKQLGYVTGEVGGYMVFGECYAPDVGFISKARQPHLPQEGYNPNPPDLAVEIVSPTDSPKRLSIKVSNYLAAGTQVWVVYPEDRQVVVHRAGAPVRIISSGEILDGGDVLPGFTLAVQDMFAEL